MSKSELNGLILCDELGQLMDHFGVTSADDSSSKSMDLSALDEESIEIVAQLILHCLCNSQSLNDIFSTVIQDETTASGVFKVIQVDDFYKTLHEKQMKESSQDYANLT